MKCQLDSEALLARLEVTHSIAAAGIPDMVGKFGLTDFYTVDDKNLNMVIGTMQSAFVGGVASVATGGKFASGAETAALGYLFNCMGHPNTNSSCTADDKPKIQAAAAACNLNMDCIEKLRMDAYQAGLPVLPYSMGKAIGDLLDLGTLPARIFTPVGQAIDSVLTLGGMYNAYQNSDWVGLASKSIGVLGGALTESAFKVYGEWSGSAGAIMGMLFESSSEGALKYQPPAKKSN